VKPGVLIPRPETELLVDLVLEIVGSKAAQIVDIGTGSGAIACAIAKNAPLAHLFALDISDEALAVTRQNVQKHYLNKQITVLKSDLLQNAPLELDIVVSNPPYIPAADIPALMPEVQKEPLLALSGGEDGLMLIRRLITEATLHLKAGGSILIEHGYDQAEAVQKLLQSAGFIGISSKLDLAAIPRVTMAKKALE
jgi:release factor glutamine methyltransferase